MLTCSVVQRGQRETCQEMGNGKRVKEKEKEKKRKGQKKAKSSSHEDPVQPTLQDPNPFPRWKGKPQWNLYSWHAASSFYPSQSRSCCEGQKEIWGHMP